ncbi:MAG: EAL domain-containing protein [Alphaproteobacteria bacterium]|nr:EAL domain-containing protein [Alphaproteobacteria bacterium]
MKLRTVEWFMDIPSVSGYKKMKDDFSKESDSSASFALKSIFVSSPQKIWRSKISWRIALTAFMTILFVQTLVLNLGGIEQHRQKQLDMLKEEARVAIASTINTNKRGTNISPYKDKQVERIMSSTHITGFSVYSYTLDYIKSYGQQMNLVARAGMLGNTYRSSNGGVYEFILRGTNVRSVFTVVVQVDSSTVERSVYNYVIDYIKIMVILSLLVTTVLMIALGRWLLEPMLFMRSNLISAFKNPEDPNIQPSPYDVSDEIGAAIDLTQKLIRQNAENIGHIKSTAEDKIHKLAYYDTLTSLPNRAMFIQHLTEKGRANEDGSVNRFAVVTLDLDHFKDINDSMGHNVGDAILRSVGRRLQVSMPDTAIISRTGEDEFAVMMQLAGDSITAKDVADRIIGVIRAEPFRVFNESFQVRASVGLSTFPDDGSDPEQVLKNADIALNRAKEEGRDTIKEYSEDFDRAVQERFQMLRDLRDALENDKLMIYYQPQLCLKTGRVIGAEALLRWWLPDNSKEGGVFVSPAVFVPVAEQSGLIVPIGQWVLQQACEFAKTCNQEHGIDVRFAINVSGNQFVHGDICNDVSRALDETGIAPNRIELEVTESVFMDDIEHTVSILHALHSKGVELAIDDFGTGYSSLSYLSQFPIDRLKIDQSFIRNALNDKDNASIARTIINLGHSLDLKVIAEGVETKAHEEFLMQQDCDEVQGFRYSRPVPPEDFIKFVKEYNGDLNSFED